MHVYPGLTTILQASLQSVLSCWLKAHMQQDRLRKRKSPASNCTVLNRSIEVVLHLADPYHASLQLQTATVQAQQLQTEQASG